MKFNFPKSWKTINEKDFDTLGVIKGNVIMNCEGAYLRPESEQIITFYSYNNADADIIKNIKTALLKNEEENVLIDGLKEDEGFTDTSLSSLVWYEESEPNGIEYFAHISKMLTEAYVFQIYFWIDDKFYSCQCKLNNSNVTSIEDYFEKNEVIVEIFNCIKNVNK